MFANSIISDLIIPLAQTGGRPVPWDGHMGFMPFGGFPMFMIGVIIVLCCLFMFRGFPGRGEGDSPLDILKKRYAKGEIDKETYEQIKKDIEGGQ